MAWTLDDHLGSSDEESAPAKQTRPDCPGCGEPDLAGDDFCHECGHSFEHLGATGVDADDLEHADPCPMCHGGELVALDHGRTQCDSCGYMSRDEGL